MARDATLRQADHVDLARLETWIEEASLDRPIRRAVLERVDPGMLAFAEACGLVCVTARAAAIGCELCDPGHLCQIVRLSPGSNVYRCPLNGDVEVADRDLELLSIDRPAFLARLGESAGVDPRSRKTYCRGHLVHFGLVGGDWGFGYAHGLADENVLAAVLEALQLHFPKSPGLLATSSLVPANLPLPKGWRLIHLRDVLKVSSGDWSVDIELARERLGRHVRTPGRSGRPSPIAMTRQLLADLEVSSDWPGRRGQQAQRVLDHWPKDMKRPAVGTIENHLRMLSRAR